MCNHNCGADKIDFVRAIFCTCTTFFFNASVSFFFLFVFQIQTRPQIRHQLVVILLPPRKKGVLVGKLLNFDSISISYLLLILPRQESTQRPACYLKKNLIFFLTLLVSFVRSF